MASKAPRARAYQPRRDRTWRRRRERRAVQPVPTLAALLTVIPSLSRPELGRLVQRMIDRMDDMEGDPDLEQEGMEDDWMQHQANGPGCSISDPGGCEHDGREVEDILSAAPRYGTDQTKGPVNCATALQRHNLEKQIADFDLYGMTGDAAHARKRLAAIKAREDTTVARANT